MAATFLQQRLFPTLRIGFAPMVARGKQEVPLHVRQSPWDGACGTFSLAMALALLGRIPDVSVLSERRKGIAARLWKAAREYYFDGISASELAAMIDSLDTDLFVASYSGSHRNCLEFALDQLASGRLAMVSWLSRDGSQHHWTLAVGLEGLQNRHHFSPETILMLDPGADEPQFCGYNGRLRFASSPKSRHVPYECIGGGSLRVRLTNVVAVGETK